MNKNKNQNLGHNKKMRTTQKIWTFPETKFNKKLLSKKLSRLRRDNFYLQMQEKILFFCLFLHFIELSYIETASMCTKYYFIFSLLNGYIMNGN